MKASSHWRPQHRPKFKLILLDERHRQIINRHCMMAPTLRSTSLPKSRLSAIRSGRKFQKSTAELRRRVFLTRSRANAERELAKLSKESGALFRHELTQHYHLTHCEHHHPVAILAGLLILIIAFVAFELFAKVHGKLVRLGKLTLLQMTRLLDLPIERWEDLQPLWSG